MEWILEPLKLAGLFLLGCAVLAASCWFERSDVK
jgi:hypothetical protein